MRVFSQSAELDFDNHASEREKKVIQQCGKICRAQMEKRMIIMVLVKYNNFVLLLLLLCALCFVCVLFFPLFWICNLSNVAFMVMMMEVGGGGLCFFVEM